MADSSTSATYTVATSGGDKISRSVTNISQSASDNQVKNLIEGLVGLTTNTLTKIEKVTTADITNGGNDNPWVMTDAVTIQQKSASGGFVILKPSTGSNLKLQFANKDGLQKSEAFYQSITASGYKPVDYYVGVGSVQVGSDTEYHFAINRSDSEKSYAAGDFIAQMTIHIPATETTKAQDFIVYFQGTEEEMELI